jgi:two-component system OmpR family response regulator
MITRRTILVADDDLATADLLAEVLEDEGYAVQRVTTGPEALAVLLADRLDLVLLDLYLPGMSGVDIMEAAHVGGIDVPIVIITASSLAIDGMTPTGARATLLKPFELDDLLACVAQHIRRR